MYLVRNTNTAEGGREGGKEGGRDGMLYRVLGVRLTSYKLCSTS